MNDYIKKPINCEEFYETPIKWIKPKRTISLKDENFAKVSSDDVIELPTKVEGIDIDKALKRIAENKEMYLSLLKIFLKEYEQKLNTINQFRNDNDLYLQITFSHSLKGDAGTIGDFNLQKKAEKLEKTIQAGGDITETVAEMTLELQLVLNSIKNLLKTIDVDKQIHIAQATDENIEEITLHINELHKMLSEGNFAAKDLFEKLKVSLSFYNIKEELTELEEMIYSFDMDGAINTLYKIAEKLQIKGGF
ncbi:MAG: Hpt domain-containing protein [Syntrophales bacterium]|nr:Hpt domain-containing protein [Syntrophales bacterium]